MLTSNTATSPPAPLRGRAKRPLLAWNMSLSPGSVWLRFRMFSMCWPRGPGIPSRWRYLLECTPETYGITQWFICECNTCVPTSWQLVPSPIYFLKHWWDSTRCGQLQELFLASVALQPTDLPRSTNLLFLAFLWNFSYLMIIQFLLKYNKLFKFIEIKVTC